jgi:hypothetical protein
MIILRSKNFALLDRKPYRKNVWDRLIHGWFGESKKSIDEYNKEVDTHNAGQNRLYQLKKTNPKKYWEELTRLDKAVENLKIIEEKFKKKLPQELYRYVDVVRNFHKDFERWGNKYPDIDTNEVNTEFFIPILPILGDVDLYHDKEKFETSIENAEKIEGINFFVDYKSQIDYDFPHEFWTISSSICGTFTRKTLKEALVDYQKKKVDIEQQLLRLKENSDVKNKYELLELVILWLSHLKNSRF